MSQPSLPLWLASAMEALQAGNVDGWMDMYASDAVHEFPFAPDGSAGRLVGREAIAAYMRQVPDRLRFGPLSDIHVREVGAETIVEATGHHRRASDGSPVEISYVWFITRRGGKIAHYRDYMNPLQLASL